MSGGILHKLEASRRDLLELGLRNPLINFRKRKRGIEVVDELSLEVFRILVAEKRTMSFAALPKGKAEVLGEDEWTAQVCATSCSVRAQAAFAHA